MKTIKFNGHVLKIHDSIQGLSITRFQKYNLNVLIDSGIGSDLNSIDTHIDRIARTISKDIPESLQELTNFQQNIHFVMSKTSPEMNSFVVLIDELNGRKITEEDLTEEGIKDIIEELGRKRFSYENMKTVLKRIKKKFDFEFETFFPELTDSATMKEYYTQLKRRTILVIESIISEKEGLEEQIASIDDFLFSKVKAGVYYGSKGIEVQTIRNFESTCTLLEFHKLSAAPKQLSTLAFYEKTVALKQVLKKK